MKQRQKVKNGSRCGGIGVEELVKALKAIKTSLLFQIKMASLTLLNCSKVEPNLHNNIIITLLMLQVHLPLFNYLSSHIWDLAVKALTYHFSHFLPQCPWLMRLYS